MSGLTFFELLGVADATAAADLWPGDRFTLVEGMSEVDDSAACAQAIQDGVSFSGLRVGSDPTVQVGSTASAGGGVAGQITMAADVHIAGNIGPFYPRDMPNLGIVLLKTNADKPATAYFADDGRGTEVLVEAIPVELQLPSGFITPAKDTDDLDGTAADFDAGDDDSVAVIKARTAPTAIRTHIRLHLTPDGDVLLEPNTPLSIDGAKLMNLPFTALHELLLIPSPRRRDMFEWARNNLDRDLGLGIPPGAIGFRSVLFDLAKPPFSDLATRFRDNSGVHSASVELVLEDVVIPVAGGVGFPLPTHGTFGIRRKITDRNSIAQAYSLSNAPFRLRLYSRDGAADQNQGLYLAIDQLEFRTGSTAADSDSAPVLEVQAALVWQGSAGSQTGGTIGVGDDWVLTAGMTFGDQSPIKLMTIAGATVAINGFKGGLRLTTLDDMSNAWEVLVDLSVHKAVDSSGGSKAFAITTLTGKDLDIVMRDIGWSFGHLKLADSIAAPEGIQLVFGGVVRLIVEELGFVEEPSGGTYFSFSGGIAIGAGGGDQQQPNSQRQGDSSTSGGSGNGVGIRFRRLRFLTSNTPSAPPFKLDGIFLNIVYGPVKIAGFGYVTDDIDSGYRYQEMGFGVSAEFPLGGVTLSLALEFLKGTKTSVTDPTDSFLYFLASLQVGWIPAGPIGLYAVRALFAYNMQPAIGQVQPGQDTGGGEGMVLYQWHKDHDGAIDMPRTRNLADWTPVKNSFAVGVGAGFSFTATGAVFHIGAFVLVTHSETDTMILVVGELYLLKNPTPIAFIAGEYDFAQEKFGVMAGVDLSLSKFAGTSIPAWIDNMAKLSGTIYFGNKPWSVAIGQLADQRTWLGIKIATNAIGLKLDLRLAVGLQITDGGPKGGGLVFSFSGRADWGIGKFLAYGSLGFIIGTWKTGSDSSGVHAWASLGFKIDLFYVFSFGADIGVDLTYLGKHPWYTTLAATIHIDTPWFMPDVTFQFSKTWNESLPFDTSSTTQALSSGSATSSSSALTGSGDLYVPPLSDGNSDTGHLYTFNELAQVHGASVAGVTLPDDLTPVAVDADIVLTFTNPLSNDALIATDTYGPGGDLGVQQVQDLTVRYALKSVAIQRSPRFGPDAGTWTDLVAAVDTELDLSGGGSTHATPAVSFRWDADSRADGVLATNRLVINARTPYTLTVGSSQNDQEGLANDPGFPCCSLDGTKPPQAPWHVLTWTGRAVGSRPGSSEQFGDAGAWWHWAMNPLAINGIGQLTGQVVALALPPTSGLIGSVDLPSPALTFMATLAVPGAGVSCVVEGYSGLTLVTMQTVTSTSPSTPVQLTGSVAAPLTRVCLRVNLPVGGLGPMNHLSAFGQPHVVAGVEIADLRYRELDDLIAIAGQILRCRGANTSTAVGGGGKLAWLPNHDYAVSATVQVTVSHRTGGSKTLTLTQPAFFRTKGLPGLNATPNVGDDLRSEVASSYPQNRAVVLYRQEPVALAFTEGMSNLLPVDRVAAAGDPPEKAQLMELTLSVEKVSSTDGAGRLTAPSADWLTQHGGVVVSGRPPFLSDAYLHQVVRKDQSADVRVQRFEAVLTTAGCDHDPLHSSQVLTHDPIAPDGTTAAWEPQAGLRATLRPKDGAYAERAGFVLPDLGAFTYLGDAGAGSTWALVDGALVAPGGGREYAAFGDPTWNYLQVTATFDLATGGASGAAGVAVGVSGSSPVAQAMLAQVNGTALQLIRRIGAAEAVVDSQDVSEVVAALTGPIELHVTAYDDKVRASVGDVVVEGDRDVVREGRVALVATERATFHTLVVDSLEMYRVEFATSRYLSFADHIASRDPVLHEQAADAMGAAPTTTPAQVRTARAAELAAAMSEVGDPQRRQQIFAEVANAIGVPGLSRCDRLTITRLTDATGTTALLLESPEPISLIHDVSLSLVQRTWRFVPAPLPGQLDPRTFAPLTKLHLADDGLVVAGGLLNPPRGRGTWVPVDTSVDVVALANGNETSILLLASTPMIAGTHLLNLAFSRTRWSTQVADPYAVYTDNATVTIRW